MPDRKFIKRIVVHSHAFLPNVGGLENIMGGLAENWKERGMEIEVYTTTPDSSNVDYGYPVTRKLSFFSLFKKIKDADIFFEANISLKTFWLGLLFRNKWYVTHQLIYEKNFKGKLKNYITRFSNNIAASKYIAANIKGKSTVISNFYNDVFSLNPNATRTQQLVFVGRMVSDKGVDLLLCALKILREKGRNYCLTLIGDGPEKQNILKMVEEWRLNDVVVMKGVLKGDNLVQELNRHKVLVVPSRWEEPFGIVALEGLACGCKVVCSSGGGLPEAVDKFGFTFKNNDQKGLADCIERANDEYEVYKENLPAVMEYLKSKTLNAVSEAYLNAFTK